VGLVCCCCISGTMGVEGHFAARGSRLAISATSCRTPLAGGHRHLDDSCPHPIRVRRRGGVLSTKTHRPDRNFRDFRRRYRDVPPMRRIHNCCAEAWGWSPSAGGRTGNCCAALRPQGFPLTRRLLQRRQYTRPTASFYGGKGPAGPTRWLAPSTAQSTHSRRCHAPGALLEFHHRPLGPLRFRRADLRRDVGPRASTGPRWYGAGADPVTGYTAGEPHGQRCQPEVSGLKAVSTLGGLSSSQPLSGLWMRAFDDLGSRPLR